MPQGPKTNDKGQSSTSQVVKPKRNDSQANLSSKQNKGSAGGSKDQSRPLKGSRKSAVRLSKDRIDSSKGTKAKLPLISKDK